MPRYASVRYDALYTGVDLRLRQDGGHLEYDLLCAAGTDLSQVIVEVQGAERLRLDGDGSLVIDTALGPILQPKPKTWECLPDGTHRAIECGFRLSGHDRFEFVAPDWSGDHALVVDPGLLWSTVMGSRYRECALQVPSRLPHTEHREARGAPARP